MCLGIPTLKIHIILESNLLKPRILVRRLAVLAQDGLVPGRATEQPRELLAWQRDCARLADMCLLCFVVVICVFIVCFALYVLCFRAAS